MLVNLLAAIGGVVCFGAGLFLIAWGYTVITRAIGGRPPERAPRPACPECRAATGIPIGELNPPLRYCTGCDWRG